MKITCPTCGGRRVIETTVPNVKKSGGVEYVSSIQPERVQITVCVTCNYAGTVDDADLSTVINRTFAEALADSDRAGRA